MKLKCAKNDYLYQSRGEPIVVSFVVIKPITILANEELRNSTHMID